MDVRPLIWMSLRISHLMSLRPTSYDLYQNLIARGLALPDDATGPADPDRPHLGPQVKIHPDVMFALRLTSTPAEVPTET